MVKVSVTDQGRGIPENKLDSIFDRYEQVRSEDQHHGAGLGLAISKAIIESHGGAIGVANRGDKGAQFWFTLPLIFADMPEFDEETDIHQQHEKPASISKDISPPVMEA